VILSTLSIMSRRRRLLLLLLPSVVASAAVLLVASNAWADPSKEDVARADVLFRDAQILVQKGQLAEGCAKFAESQKLDPANGTLLNLAICHEKEGKYATSYKELQELIGILQNSKSADDKERTKVANERLKVVEKKLTRVSFDVSALPPNPTLTLDGEKVQDPSSSLPLDPGPHAVEVTAGASGQKKPGRKSFEVRDPGPMTVKLDPLEDANAATPPKTVDPPNKVEKPDDKGQGFWNGQRVLGAVVAGVGLVGIGVGTYFGLDTFSKKAERDKHCDDKVCDPTGLKLHDDAGSSATIATVGVGIGGAAFIVGAILFVTASPKAPEGSGSVTVGFGPNGGVIRGRF
jgi:hypothetical protein